MESLSHAKSPMPVGINKREHSRTSVGAGTVIDISLNTDSDHQFWGLLQDGSYGGCGVVAVTDLPLAPGQLCTIEMGGVGPVSARVVWVKELESSIIRFGLEYLI